MEFKFSTGHVIAFCRNNWFKLAVAVLGLYIYFEKDFQLNVQVQVPEKTEQHPARSHEKMTDIATTAHVDKLELPFIGSRRPKGRDALTELSAISDGVKHAYLQRFAEVSQQEHERFGIPTSVILATALYQSCAGKRDLALQAENHFALSCDSGWRSACKSFQGKSYRKYDSAWASFRDFSKYADLHFAELKGSDYTSWAMGMQRAGYGEDAAFAKNLIAIIEGYRLQELN